MYALYNIGYDFCLFLHLPLTVIIYQFDLFLNISLQACWWRTMAATREMSSEALPTFLNIMCKKTKKVYADVNYNWLAACGNVTSCRTNNEGIADKNQEDATVLCVMIDHSCGFHVRLIPDVLVYIIQWTRQEDDWDFHQLNSTFLSVKAACYIYSFGSCGTPVVWSVINALILCFISTVIPRWFLIYKTWDYHAVVLLSHFMYSACFVFIMLILR